MHPLDGSDSHFSTIKRNADLNFYHTTAKMAEHAVKGSALFEEVQIFSQCGLSIPYFNNHFITDFTLLKSPAWQETSSFFAGKKIDYQLVIPESDAHLYEQLILDAGFSDEGDVPAFLFDSKSATLAIPNSYEHIDIKKVSDETTYADFKTVAGPAFGMNEYICNRILTPSYLADSTHQLFVGYIGENPVSTSVLSISHDTAGIYWVATKDDERRKGYAEALTFHAATEGFRRGICVASLQATQMGAPVYVRMGFKSYYSYRKYLKKLAV